MNDCKKNLPTPGASGDEEEYEIVNCIRIPKNWDYQPYSYKNSHIMGIPNVRNELENFSDKLATKYAEAFVAVSEKVKKRRNKTTKVVRRNKKLGKQALEIMDTAIRSGKSPMQCLLGPLRNIKKDPWLDILCEDFDDIDSFEAIADKERMSHRKAFDRFKGIWYRRKNELGESSE